ncbi:hypothetical protein SETIT_2G052200v2 [Setaria italica]|uniref:Uncharacterized protein n=1 Tax=Setaria italica TaxID=4555 RepID=A0A368PVH1_SETIT|nr:hypothetical protein SETIT_2G052200v2 [Setaria italica]
MTIEASRGGKEVSEVGLKMPVAQHGGTTEHSFPRSSDSCHPTSDLVPRAWPVSQHTSPPSCSLVFRCGGSGGFRIEIAVNQMSHPRCNSQNKLSPNNELRNIYGVY